MSAIGLGRPVRRFEAYTWPGPDVLRRKRREHELHGRSARVLDILDEVFADRDAPRSDRPVGRGA